LQTQGESRLFNHPLKTLARYELLKLLHAEGINEFRASRVDEIPEDLRYPCFLRIANDHQGSRTPLLRSRAELDKWILKAVLGSVEAKDLLVTEFSDTMSLDGLYRKYSAYRIGGRLVAKHVHFSRNWMLKNPDVATPATLEEERGYMENIPDQPLLHRIFDLASVDYGRVDYGYKNGRLQVWEINTNPVLMLADVKPAHVPAQRLFSGNLLEALKAIDIPRSVNRVPLRLSWSASSKPERNKGALNTSS
ncbi:MAG TPA: hypothetical protein VMI31_11020, partial [Fimbriimonadaceae bacterium]|nr:hypothetical protein [Fimbriimonadaceae bacterium]